MPEPLPALQIRGAGEAGGAAASPLDMVSKFATIQNALNQNRLFQQTFMARQQAGQIIASAPDLDTGLQNLFKNPTVAPFAGEFANTVRQMQSTMADIATKKQALTQSGLSYTLHGLASSLADPSTLEANLKAGLSTVDPMAAPGASSAVGSVVSSLGHGLPSDPAAARALYNARLVGTLLSSGHTPETIKAITGEPVTVAGTDPATGLRTEQGAVRAPAFAGGGLQIGGGGVVGGMSPGEAIATHPGPLSPTLQPQTVTGGDIFRGGVPGLGGSMPGQEHGSPNSLAPAPGNTPTATRPGAATAPAPGQTKAIEGAAQSYTEEGRKTYDAAVTGLASVQYMDRAFDELSRGGGWETPGTAVNGRLGIAKGINTLAQVFGADPTKLPFDSGKVATWEEFNKETQRATLQLVNQMFGAQRESQMVVQGAARAIPAAENTPLGGKLVLKSLEQTMLREVDRRNFETNWWQSHSGNLIGANEAFNSQYKPQLYSQRAISTIQPYEIEKPEEAANYLAGTFVKEKGGPRVFQVPATMSKYPPVVFQGAGR